MHRALLVGLLAVPAALATGFIRLASVLDGAQADFELPDDPLLAS